MDDSSSPINALETRMRPKLVSGLLLWLIVGFFLVALLWAWLTEVDKSVSAIGRVIPSSQLQTVSNLEGGIVDTIYVKTGQLVAAGAPLIQLNQTFSGAELGSGEATIRALVAKIDRLRAEVTGGTPSLSGGGPQFEIERALYQAREAERSAIVTAGEARVTAASRAVGEAQAMFQSRRAQAGAAASEVSAIRPLVERGIEPQLSLTLAQSRATATSSEAIAASASVSRAQAGVAEARATTAQQQSDWRARSGTELATAQAELSARRGAMPALADRVRRTLVTAPVSGRINRVFAVTTGGTIAPGSPLVEIVPSDDALIIEALVNPKDIAAVHLSQAAQIAVTAYDSAIYGRLIGHVIAISPDAIVNERTGESHYLVRVRTTVNVLAVKNGKHPIGPGMIADVSILGDKQSILSYIFSPITKLKDKAFRE